MLKIKNKKTSLVEEGALKGRRGLGSIFVWASGNGGKFQVTVWI
jgi:hypothetical protein